ncbi:MAG: S-methyl-5-thioribose-1-phosphate isomerase, partial [Deltaproteobacteria bacterium]
KSGDEIPVEERNSEEISHFRNKEIGPPGVKAINPAFDVTPNRYVSAIITEKGVIRPPFRSQIRKFFQKEQISS